MKKSRNKLNLEWTDNYGQAWKAKQINIEDGLIMLKKIVKYKIGR